MNTNSPFLCVVVLVGAAAAQTQFENTPLVPSPTALSDVVAADFDGDGDIDLVAAVALGPSGLVMLRNDGRGRFIDATAASLPPAGIPGGAAGPLLAFDMDGDGDLDIFVGRRPSSMCLLRNNGSGVFAEVVGSLLAFSGPALAASAADFDGDGDIDLACVSNFLIGGQNRIYRNNGAGIFSADFVIPVLNGLSVAVADVDGDGDPDFAVGESSAMRLFRNDGGLAFTDVTTSQLPALFLSSVFAVGFGDLDGDGDRDLVFSNWIGAQDYVMRNTAGTFTTIAVLPSAGTSALVLVDVDEDGDLDLVRAKSTTTLSLALNDGSGALADAPSRVPVFSNSNARVVAADIDRDGDQDLLVADWLAPSLLRNRHRHIAAGPAILGQTWTVDVWSEPGYATLDHTSRLAIGLARLPQPLIVPGFGALWLDLGAGYALANAVLPRAAGVVQYGFLVPSVPVLVGLELHAQALVEQWPGPARFTGFESVVIQ